MKTISHEAYLEAVEKHTSAFDIMQQYQAQIFLKHLQIVNDQFIIDCGLSQRVQNTFHELGIIKVSDLANFTIKDFKRVRNLGAVSLHEIKNFYIKQGLPG